MIAWAVTSSVLIAVVIALRFLFRRKISRRLQYALWGLVLLRLLMPFSLFGSTFSVMNAVDAALPTDSLSGIQVQVYADVPPNTGTAPEDSRAIGHSTLHETEENDDGSRRNYFFTGPLDLVRVLRIVWLIGGIAVGLWFIGANLVMYKRLRNNRQAFSGQDCKLPVYVTSHAASPCLFGLIRPAVYLIPKAVASADSTRHVLAHELCHYRHGDHIWSMLRCLCLAVWWWNPLVWAAAILSRTDGELACDEAAIKTIGREKRFSYGHTLVDMIAVGKTPGLMYAATTMVSGKRHIKGRINMIIKNPKTVIPVAVAVLLMVAVSAGCTFTGAEKAVREPGFPEVDTVFFSDSADLTEIGCDAAAYYYQQFMGDDIPQYWHITAHEIVSCELQAGDAREFCVWITSYLETDGGGFLVGQGIADDPEDISQGGVCPEVGQQFRIKSLGDGQYEIVSVSTGGGDQDLAPVETAEYNAPEDAPASIDRTDLEACVSDAILNTNAGLYLDGDFAAEAHTILKTEEIDNSVHERNEETGAIIHIHGDKETTVYAMVYYTAFRLVGEAASEVASVHGPAAITFEKKSDTGEYILKEYWTPQDGEGWASSIKAKFPADVYEDALNTQKYIDAHKRSCYEQVIAQASDLESVIARRIDIILSSPAQASDPQAYIDEHIAQYRHLIDIGEHTLRYCFNVFEQGGQTGLKGHIMAMACREILGDAGDVDVPAATGQAWYDALPQSVKEQYR